MKHLLISVLAVGFLLCTTGCSVPDNQLSKAEKAEGWSLLFDGKNLSQWTNYGAESLNSKWIIEEGLFYIADDSGEAGDIVTKKHYENFEMKIDWKIAEKGNSGIFLRVDETGKKAHSYAIEIQMLDDENFRTSKGEKPGDDHKSGSIYDIKAAEPGAFKGHNSWNTTHIIVKGKIITVNMNGILVAEVDMESATYKKLFADSKFARNKNVAEKFAKGLKGPIGLQDHRAQMWFKNVKIREL